MADSATSSLLVILLLVSPLLCICSSQGSSTTFRVILTHIDADLDLSPLQVIKRSIQRGKQRHRKFLDGLELMSTQASSDVRTRVVGGDGEFRMSLSIGTPPVPFLAIMDTGSDLIWTQCQPCKTCFKQPTPIFDPAESSSFANVSCSSPVCKKWADSKCGRSCEYSNSYGDGTSTEGFLATETFNFGGSDNESSVPDIGFGCGVNNEGPGLNHGAGIVGLGRGPLSLVSQIHTRQFSYCLTSIGGTNGSSSLFLGSAPSSVQVSNASTTPLLENPVLPTFYYISLVGISVGRNRLPIPPSWFQLTSDGTGGLIVDSGTTITLLTEDAYDVLKRAFLEQTKLALSDSSDHSGLDLCFNLPHGKHAKQIAVPELTFHFTGLDLALPPENYMIVDENLGMACLAIAPAGGFSTLGNIQQQNMLVIHNLEQKTMSFIPTDCAKL
ncbi:aspartic proteinase nepenthesin-1-like [Juglans microcarpa x Juglans regia]|uniref:aspartic proteinase nepenthesin-1-like n=1 Tax=Juglans microcarpa x Juglans regia TaxID=2249226 RepID=UPI001B7EF526|nr:aspartic proteinase nepenthesin-1-like [Juglans microcarpa x Juglans regia]